MIFVKQNGDCKDNRYIIKVKTTINHKVSNMLVKKESWAPPSCQMMKIQLRLKWASSHPVPHDVMIIYHLYWRIVILICIWNELGEPSQLRSSAHRHTIRQIPWLSHFLFISLAVRITLVSKQTFKSLSSPFLTVDGLLPTPDRPDSLRNRRLFPAILPHGGFLLRPLARGRSSGVRREPARMVSSTHRREWEQLWYIP